jgi:hypothetical protein
VSKWKETCKLIERYIPEYLLKRFLEYYWLILFNLFIN